MSYKESANVVINRYGPRAIGVGSYTLTNEMRSDVNDLARPGVALLVFAAGSVVFTAADGIEDTWTITEDMLPFQIPVAVTRIKQTGTTIPSASIKVIC